MLQFTVGEETYRKLRRAQDLLRHAVRSRDPAEIFGRALTCCLRTWRRRDTGLRRDHVRRHTPSNDRDMSRRPLGVQSGHATTAAVDLKERPAVARAFNREHGMHALLPGAVRETVLNPLHVLAQVRWSARFEKTGPRATEFEIAYLLELDGESWRILGYVSARDQEEEMRPLGVL